MRNEDPFCFFNILQNNQNGYAVSDLLRINAQKWLILIYQALLDESESKTTTENLTGIFDRSCPRLSAVGAKRVEEIRMQHQTNCESKYQKEKFTDNLAVAIHKD
jgi:Zn-dependent M32 family carboxypeptidase